MNATSLNLTAINSAGAYQLSTSTSGVLGLGFGALQGATQWFYKNLLLTSYTTATFNSNFLGLGLVG